MSLADSLARVLLARAKNDPQFRRALANWRRRKAIQALNLSTAGSRPADAGAAPPDAGAATIPVTPADRARTNDDLRGRTDRPGRWYRRVPGWVGPSIVGPVVAGIVLLAVPGLAGKIFDRAPAAPAGGSSLPATASDSPARVETVTPLNTAPGENYAIADKVDLPAGQLAQLSADSRSGGSGQAAAEGLLSSIHAVPIGHAITNVTVMGNEKAPVTITEMQVVRHCQAPLAGTLISSPAQGVNGTISLGFDLDSQIYYARKYNYGYHGGDYFHDKVVTLAPGEVQTFAISVQASLHYCQFTFQLTVATTQGTVTEKIDDNGKPFQLTGRAGHDYAAEYVGGIAAMLAPALHDPRGNFVQVNPKTFHG